MADPIGTQVQLSKCNIHREECTCDFQDGSRGWNRSVILEHGSGNKIVNFNQFPPSSSWFCPIDYSAEIDRKSKLLGFQGIYTSIASIQCRCTVRCYLCDYKHGNRWSKFSSWENSPVTWAAVQDYRIVASSTGGASASCGLPQTCSNHRLSVINGHISHIGPLVKYWSTIGNWWLRI